MAVVLRCVRHCSICSRWRLWTSRY